MLVSLSPHFVNVTLLTRSSSIIETFFIVTRLEQEVDVYIFSYTINNLLDGCDNVGPVPRLLHPKLLQTTNSLIALLLPGSSNCT